MDRKLNFSGYFTSDDESCWVPYTAAADLWNTRYASVFVFAPVAPRFEKEAEKQVLAAVAKRQRFSPTDPRAMQMFGRNSSRPNICFSPTDPRAMQMFGREEFRPVIDSLTIGLEVLLTFIGALTLGIG